MLFSKVRLSKVQKTQTSTFTLCQLLYGSGTLKKFRRKKLFRSSIEGVFSFFVFVAVLSFLFWLLSLPFKFYAQP